MKIENDKYFIEDKIFYNPCSVFKQQTIEKVFEFAYEMSFGEGEHRNHRSGGQYNRKNGQIFINAFQGKLAELGVYNYIFSLNKAMYKQLSLPDFDVHGSNKWDDFDISYKNIKFSIKSTKFYGNLLLLETKDWDMDAQYIPNIEKGNSHYDYTILGRIAPDGEKLMKDNNILKSDVIEKELLMRIILSQEWSCDIPGYISNLELKSIIQRKQIIPQNALLNGKIPMDAENYYEETGKLKDFGNLVKSFK